MNEAITLLYVDDEPINIIIFEINFKKKFKVITAENGMEGLAKLDSNTEIIVVISDMRMPEMNGIEFITKAKAKYDHVAYYILTGFDISDEISAALDDNIIQKYFQKPFNIQEIEDAINAFTASR